VIEYRVDGQADVVRLITSLTDHEKYPAEKLDVLYARRWEIELVFDEIKTHQRGRTAGSTCPSPCCSVARTKVSRPTATCSPRSRRRCPVRVVTMPGQGHLAHAQDPVGLACPIGQVLHLAGRRGANACLS
jgi:hypothetical protein